jgi:hypothetical protein
LDALEDPMQKALARLRAKTDRELGILAEKQLEQTMTLIDRGRYREACAGYDTTLRLIAVARLSPMQREHLDKQLAHIRKSIAMPASAA